MQRQMLKQVAQEKRVPQLKAKLALAIVGEGSKQVLNGYKPIRGNVFQ